MDFTIDHYGWDQVGPFPIVKGSIDADLKQLNVLFDVKEPDIRAVHTIHNQPVCEDSCVELFFSPYISDSETRYINIEVNPIGTVFASIGTGRYDRSLLTNEQIGSLDIKTKINRGTALIHWTVQYMIPFSLLAEVYKLEPIKECKEIICNMYKCGDKLPKPHWGSRKPVNTDKPDFHRPEYFTKFLL